MNEAQKKLFREKLSSEIKSTEEDITRLKELTKPVSPDNAIGRISRMEAIESKSIKEANLRNAQQRLSQLKKAESCLNDEDFGECTLCGEDIPLARLLLVPHSSVCVHCAS